MSLRGFKNWWLVWGLIAGCSDDGSAPVFIVPGVLDAGARADGGAGGRASNTGSAAGNGGNSAGRAPLAGRGNVPTAGAAGGSGDCSAAAPSFVDDIGPLLGSRCTKCHDAGGPAGLDLRSYAALLAGGAHGPAIVPGDCAASLVWQKTGPMPPFGARMPADGAPLSEAQREELCMWIQAGAPERAAASNCPEPGMEPCMGDTCPMQPPVTDDDLAPEFDGLDRVEENGSSCMLSWDAASDDQSSASAIRYAIFVREKDGDFAAEPTTVTEPGATTFTLMLEPGSDYELLVVAVDEAGNRDANDRVRECSLR